MTHGCHSWASEVSLFSSISSFNQMFRAQNAKLIFRFYRFGATIAVFISFPTCQVRVVRILMYEARPSPSSSSSPPAPPPSPLAMMRGQCGVPDLNRDPVRSVFCTGPQPRSCEFSVPHRTSTAIL